MAAAMRQSAEMWLYGAVCSTTRTYIPNIVTNIVDIPSSDFVKGKKKGSAVTTLPS